MTNKEKIWKVMEDSKKMLTINEITDMCNKPYDSDENFIVHGQTPEKTVGSILYTSYNTNDNGGLKRSENPLRWGLKSCNYDNEIENFDVEIIDNDASNFD